MSAPIRSRLLTGTPVEEHGLLFPTPWIGVPVADVGNASDGRAARTSAQVAVQGASDGRITRTSVQVAVHSGYWDGKQSTIDPVGITDSVSTAVKFKRVITETVGVADSVIHNNNGRIARSSAQVAVQGMSSVQTARTSTQVAAETNEFALTVVTSTDDVGVTDSVSTAMAYKRTITESVGVTDSILYGDFLTETPMDNIGVTDSVQAAITASRAATEAVGITDSVSYVLTPTATSTESWGMVPA